MTRDLALLVTALAAGLMLVLLTGGQSASTAITTPTTAPAQCPDLVEQLRRSAP